MINITLLGSGGGMPMPNRFLSSMAINLKGRKILIDCGEGTQVSMRKLNIGFKSIDIICFTHMHGDHIFGLPGLLATMGNSERTEKVTIIGPQGTFEFIKGLMSSFGYLPFELEIIENPNNRLEIISIDGFLQVKGNDKIHNCDMVISSLELDHSSPCLGYAFYVPRRPKFSLEKASTNEVPKEIWKRLQNGETIAYNDKNYEPDMVLGENRLGLKVSIVTDSRPIKTIPDFIKESDLFICEGTYGDNNDIDKAIKNKHMTFYEAARLAKEGNVKEMILTHFSPSIENPESFFSNAAEIFKNTTIGYDSLKKVVTYEDWFP